MRHVLSKLLQIQEAVHTDISLIGTFDTLYSDLFCDVLLTAVTMHTVGRVIEVVIHCLITFLLLNLLIGLSFLLLLVLFGNKFH